METQWIEYTSRFRYMIKYGTTCVDSGDIGNGDDVTGVRPECRAQTDGVPMLPNQAIDRCLLQAAHVTAKP